MQCPFLQHNIKKKLTRCLTITDLYLSKLVSLIAFPCLTGNNNSGGPVSAPANSGMLGIGGGVTLLPAFEYRGTWIPILTVTVQGSAKAT